MKTTAKNPAVSTLPQKEKPVARLIDAQDFKCIAVGELFFVFRPSKARMTPFFQGKAGSWFVAGGLIIRPGKRGNKIDTGTLAFIDGKHDAGAVHSSPLVWEWLKAGARIGEQFTSYDAQPKFSSGAMQMISMTRKRIPDYANKMALWTAWKDWRENGSRQTFEVFHFGDVENTEAYRSTSRAAVELLASIGLSVSRKFPE